MVYYCSIFRNLLLLSFFPLIFLFSTHFYFLPLQFNCFSILVFFSFYIQVCCRMPQLLLLNFHKHPCRTQPYRGTVRLTFGMSLLKRPFSHEETANFSLKLCLYTVFAYNPILTMRNYTREVFKICVAIERTFCK